LSDSCRAFFAYTLEQSSLDSIFSLSSRMLSHAPGNLFRGIKRENYHITALFLGDISQDQLTSAAEILESVRAECDIPTLAGGTRWIPRGFPSRGSPRLLAMVPREETSALLSPVLALREAAAAAGLPFDARGFAPHITLAYVRRKAPRGEVRAFLESQGRQPGIDGNGLALKGLNLLVSTLAPGGSVYRVVS
jgi:2'-5' RNA ligase